MSDNILYTGDDEMISGRELLDETDYNSDTLSRDELTAEIFSRPVVNALKNPVLSLSVVTSGNNMSRNGILSIGLCYTDGVELMKKQFNMVLETGQIPINNAQLSKQDNMLLRELKNGASLPKDKIPQFTEYIRSLPGGTITTIFQNHIEISFVEYYIAKYSGYNCLHDVNPGIIILDISAYCQGVCCSGEHLSDSELLAKLGATEPANKNAVDNKYNPIEMAQSRLTFYNNVMDRAREFAMV